MKTSKLFYLLSFIVISPHLEHYLFWVGFLLAVGLYFEYAKKD